MNRKHFLLHTALFTSATLVPSACRAGLPDGNDSPPTDPRIVRRGEGDQIVVLGDRMQLKLTGADTNGRLTLIEEYNAPGVGIPPHVHEHEDEIFHVIEGELELTVDGETTILRAGDMGYGPRGIAHSWRTVGAVNTRVHLTAFPSGVESLFERLAGLPAGPPDLEKVGALCAEHGIRFL